ncbi:MAG TPA: OmpA family protein [Steroidobacteraceae bacterium]|jgi:outer membrane protein OmpA-like peptidoglycan-associated protein
MMTMRSTRAARLLAACTLASAPLLASAANPPSGAGSTGVVSAAQIEQALQGQAQPKTRGLFVRAKTETKQMIDLNIPFEYNSSELQPQATAQLKQLRSALTSDSLGKDRFVVAGHTDAKGNAQYNQQLSVRRAEAVKRYLVENGVAAGRLQAVGYGSQQLAVPEHPDDPANRRVEIRNLGENP